jgi:hypothetical protein
MRKRRTLRWKRKLLHLLKKKKKKKRKKILKKSRVSLMWIVTTLMSSYLAS